MLTCAEVMWITVHSRDCSLNRFHRPATNDCGQQQEGALPAIPDGSDPSNDLWVFWTSFP